MQLSQALKALGSPLTQLHLRRESMALPRRASWARDLAAGASFWFCISFSKGPMAVPGSGSCCSPAIGVLTAVKAVGEDADDCQQEGHHKT